MVVYPAPKAKEDRAWMRREKVSWAEGMIFY
jgi:hypothetical protein